MKIIDPLISFKTPISLNGHVYYLVVNPSAQYFEHGYNVVWGMPGYGIKVSKKSIMKIVDTLRAAGFEEVIK